MIKLINFPDILRTTNLSEASKGTLINQGGPMSSTEASAFEQHPDFQGFMTYSQLIIIIQAFLNLNS